MNRSSTTNGFLKSKQGPRSSTDTLKLQGIIPPLVTPLDVKGELDKESLQTVVEHVLAGGVHGVFALGTTGEATGLSQAVRKQVIQEVCQLVRGRVPVLVGLMDSVLENCLSLASEAAEQGADAIVVSAPYYFKLEQAELLHYVRTIRNHSSLPIYLYNIPELTGTEFTPETVLRLTELTQVVGIKDSSGNPEYLSAIQKVAAVREDWSILVGSDELLVDSVMKGIHGGVSGSANVWPQLLVALYESASRKDSERCSSLSSILKELMSIFKFGSYGIGGIRGMKCALSLLGICEDRLAAPYVECDSEQREFIKGQLMSLDLLGDASEGLQYEIPKPHFRSKLNRNASVNSSTHT